MVLPTNIDSTYADDGSDASVQLHQSHHDTVHGAVNALAGGTTGQVLAKTSSADFASSWVTPGYGGGDYFRSGQYYIGAHQSAGFSSDTGPGLNTVAYHPFFVPVSRAFDRVGLNIASAGVAGAVIRLGIYTNTGGLPDALVVGSGAIASDTSGSKELTIAVTLSPGTYWLAAVMQVATCTWRSLSGAWLPPSAAAGTTPPTGMSGAGYWASGVSGALPATAPALGGQWGTPPALALRAA